MLVRVAVLMAVGAGLAWDGSANPPSVPDRPRESVGLLVESVPIAHPLDLYSEERLSGFQVLVDPDLGVPRSGWRRVRAALLADLDRVVEVLPPAALDRVRQTPIVVTRATPPRPDWEGGSAACLHVSEDWLLSHGYDAARVGVVEILHADKYLLWRAEQPLMLLHELAHAYHLGGERSYDEPRIVAAYDAAMAAGLYDAVDHVLAEDGRTRRAYAASNPQEYFAELSEAYFGRNDFFPFTREDLIAHDPGGYAAVVELWGLDMETQP